MNDECEIYTGKLTYRGIDFTFVFSNEELRLIPPKDKVYIPRELINLNGRLDHPCRSN